MKRFARCLFTLTIAMIAVYQLAWAHEQEVRGIVLGIEPAKGEIIVRTDQTPIAPSVTSAFRVSDRRALKKLRVGNGISATLDSDKKPPVLSDVRVVGDQALTGQSQVRAVTHLRLGDEVPQTQFVDQSGRPFSFAQLRGKYVILSFIYTRCQDTNECPLISAHFAQLQDRLGPESRLVEVSLDPDYDRPPILRDYARTFAFRPDRVTLLTGDPNTVLDFAAMFGVSAFSDPKAGFVHNTDTAIIDPQGKIGEMITENTWTPDEIIAVIANYERRPSNPLARLDLALGNKATIILLWILALAAGWLIFRLMRRIAGRNA